MTVYRTTGGSSEWFSPAHVVAAGRAALGGRIDLDPASCREANRVVKAKRFFTREDNGLSLPWSGRVWMNPPYERALVREFTGKLLLECGVRRVLAAVVLTNNSSDAGWWHDLAAAALGMCFLRGRLRFRLPSSQARARRVRSPMQGSVVWYFGDEPERFERAFDSMGIIRWRCQW